MEQQYFDSDEISDEMAFEAIGEAPPVEPPKQCPECRGMGEIALLTGGALCKRCEGRGMILGPEHQQYSTVSTFDTKTGWYASGLCR